MRPSVVIRSWLLFTLIFVLAGCDKTVAPKLDNPYDSESASYVAFPELTTLVVKQVSTTQAESGGSFGTDYGSEVSAKGVCWAEHGAASGLPVVGGNCTDEGSGFGAFVSVMTGLAPGVSYVVRSYATNSDGTVYGGERMFTMGIMYMLEVSEVGSGTVVPGSGIYEEGTQVELTALASDGWRFVEWMGDVAGGVNTDNPLMVTMDGDKSVTAVFEQIPVYTLTTSIEGSGTVVPGSGSYEEGTEVDLTAQASNGWRFVEWTGDVVGGGSTDNPLIVTMDGDKSVTAVFEQVTVPSVTTSPITSIMESSAQGGGTVTSDGNSEVTSRGLCWSTVSSPTTNDSCTNNGSGSGNFTSVLTNLISSTRYYVRAFAINSEGTAYGNQLDFMTAITPPELCDTLPESTPGTSYTMQTPSQSTFQAGSMYRITMYSPIFNFGQGNVQLYKNNTLLFSYGSWLPFGSAYNSAGLSNTRDFTIPSVTESSACYNMRVTKGGINNTDQLWVSPTFEIQN